MRAAVCDEPQDQFIIGAGLASDLELNVLPRDIETVEKKRLAHLA
ncbi:hypothetical protein WOB59_01910 [Methylocystis sp. IM4]